ncbi:cysteine--1-D-myo-inosityl 2-amino-2-deoxy-alpha-D-glucopyranoside ligase [Kineosporia sp. J2-2]|uniref:L-cysteine:1D-myo-inositol 2-amino-2-deoxy-alpha-D-glucopyranoside ligase n=1 Tax=Kineosporia corallincola TaxID=2835133 RepID=A0ABS5TQJ0_9ACTN|nr:cysteine--1-D-myo-inosityl 2-amino-2-deoxy-alpha-D-glucopyranoside ligase [Kineosporia corallincola]MBT0771924.1 cysteine--1-D-myo-inosityl 2-amino-2-deoxy-alpha-D-glucopyranoside ligase [Kineosporia corallincola]
MIPWPSPAVPRLPGSGEPVRVFDSSERTLVTTRPEGEARMYVCGITPYDATHIGHASTYVAFDLLHRAWLDAGHEVFYVQNVTDVDDPLLERANATGDDWRALADRETARFKDDMIALGVIAPRVFMTAVESVPLVVEAVQNLVKAGKAYLVPTPDALNPGAQDVYFDVTADRDFGRVAKLPADEARATFAERGGDPDRPGKRNALDPLLWRGARDGEPSWDGETLGAGRPGWHIECASIALEHLGMGFDVQGGGDDLLFPHHEMSASHGQVITGDAPFARHYAHAGMVRLDGEKMSKSRGNLVFVSKLRGAGEDPQVIRLAILAHHYRTSWDWTDANLAAARTRLERWKAALSRQEGPDPEPVLAAVRAAVATDLNAPQALAAVDAWVDEQLTTGGPVEGAPGLVSRTIDALLGVRF